jgi:hypothetical protein
MEHKALPQKCLATALLVVILLSLTAALSIHNSAATTRDISRLTWLTGDWQTPPGEKAQIDEHWIAPAGGSMMGLSRTVANGKVVEFEFLRIEQRGDAIYYVAYPQGRCSGTDFKLTNLSGQEAVFENPQHDFPKRITYRKNSDGSLVASIDGGPNTKSLSFAYRPMSK